MTGIARKIFGVPETPLVEEAKPMPIPDDEQVKRKKKKELARRRGGRKSTVLTERLGE